MRAMAAAAVVAVVMGLCVSAAWVPSRYPALSTAEEASLAVRYEMLRGVFAHPATEKLPFFVVEGTLLSAVRDGALLPWDNDIDVGIDAARCGGVGRVRAALSAAFDATELRVVDHANPEGRAHLRVVHPTLDVFADVYLFDVAATAQHPWTDMDYSVEMGSPVVVNAPVPTGNAAADRVAVAVPANAEAALAGTYGAGWRKADHCPDMAAGEWVAGACDVEEAFPLVSVMVLTTPARRPFLANALALVARQTYPNVEVVLVGDDAEAAAPNVAGHLALVRVPVGAEQRSIGAKRQAGLEAARGAVVVHWDDDDYYRPQRIVRQVLPILAGTHDLTVYEHGLYLFLGGEGMRFRRVQRPAHWGPHMGSLTYRRVARTALQTLARFPDVSLAEDYTFAERALDAGYALAVLPDTDGQFVYVRHAQGGGNTWQIDEEGLSGHMEAVPRPQWFSDADARMMEGARVAAGSVPRSVVHEHVDPATRWDRPELKARSGSGAAPPSYYIPTSSSAATTTTGGGNDINLAGIHVSRTTAEVVGLSLGVLLVVAVVVGGTAVVLVGVLGLILFGVVPAGATGVAVRAAFKRYARQREFTNKFADYIADDDETDSLLVAHDL